MQIFPQMNTPKLITSDKLNITQKIKGTENCKEKEVIYAPQCSKQKILYIGHAWKQPPERFSKHRCDIKNDQTIANLQNIFTKVTI